MRCGVALRRDTGRAGGRSSRVAEGAGPLRGLLALLPGAREPLAETADRVGGQVREERGEVRLDVDAGLARVLHEREQVRQPRPGLRVPNEEPILRVMGSCP
jgi:hypothetical protein